MISDYNSVVINYKGFVIYEKVGKCWNTEHPNYIYNAQHQEQDKLRKTIIKNPIHLLDELKTGDQTHIYMFGDNSWKVVITKKIKGFSSDVYKTKK